MPTPPGITGKITEKFGAYLRFGKSGRSLRIFKEYQSPGESMPDESGS
jgi:hypothetical protein